jgi:hypothetical protein
MLHLNDKRATAPRPALILGLCRCRERTHPRFDGLLSLSTSLVGAGRHSRVLVSTFDSDCAWDRARTGVSAILAGAFPLAPTNVGARRIG